MRIDSAYDRVFRNLVVSVGLGSIIFTLLGLAAILEQHPLLNPWYSVTTIAVYCGLPPAMAAVATRVSVPTLRILAGIHSAGTIVFLLLWVPAMTVPSMPIEATPWLINTITVAMTTAAFALPALPSWIYLLAVSALSGAVRYVVYGGGDALLAFQDGVMGALFSSVMVSLLQLSLRAGREQDAAAHAAQEAAANAASAETAHRQRAMYDAFTHDDVLATLLSAARNTEGTARESSSSAQRALVKLDALRDSADPRVSLAPDELESLLHSSAASADQRIVVRYRETPEEGIHAPMEVCHALAEALAEALRNSVRHASPADGRAVRRDAVALIGRHGVRIEVSDDGKGFDPRRIGLDRLGVRVSILRRLNSLPGGRAVIRSTRGSGTTVILEWHAPEAAIES